MGRRWIEPGLFLADYGETLGLRGPFRPGGTFGSFASRTAPLQRWLDLPPAERLAMHLALALAVLGASTAARVAAGWIGRWWPSAVRLQYTALAVAAVALGALLVGWHLIGWGMT